MSCPAKKLLGPGNDIAATDPVLALLVNTLSTRGNAVYVVTIFMNGADVPAEQLKALFITPPKAKLLAGADAPDKETKYPSLPNPCTMLY